MTVETKQTCDRKWLINSIAASLSIMFFLGIFAELLVRNRLIHFEDPVLTLKTIKESVTLFESGILAFIVVILLDIVLSICFYQLLAPVQKAVAQIMVSLRLIYVAIKGFALVGLFMARDLYSNADQIHTDSIATTSLLAMRYLKMHQYGFGVGLIFFGLHLLCLAFLFFRARQIQRWIVWLLAFAGAGYIANSLADLFAANHHQLRIIIIAVFIIPMSVAELILGWSLWFRRKT